MARYLLDTNVLISISHATSLWSSASAVCPSIGAPIEAEFLEVWQRLLPFAKDNGARLLGLMRKAVPDWRAPESRQVLKTAKLPDPKDRHVLAAAVGVGADVIVTNNLKDFPADVLTNYGVIARSPDDVLCELLDAEPDAFLIAARAMRARMNNPPMDVEAWLGFVAKAGCGRLAAQLEPILLRGRET